MTSGVAGTGFWRVRSPLGMASRRIVRATAVSTAPGSARALIAREPIHMNATTSSAAPSARNIRKAFRTGFITGLASSAATLQGRSAETQGVADDRDRTQGHGGAGPDRADEHANEWIQQAGS